MGVTYDTGALIAAGRGERRMWARHRALPGRRQIPAVPAPVVAQSWCGSVRQVQLARLLAGAAVLHGDDARTVADGGLPDQAVLFFAVTANSQACGCPQSAAWLDRAGVFWGRMARWSR